MTSQSVLDIIESAQKSNIIPDQEFLLQGTVIILVKVLPLNDLKMKMFGCLYIYINSLE